MNIHHNSSFAELFDEMRCLRRMTCIRLSDVTGFNRIMFSRIMNGHIPKKVNVITIGVALLLNLNEMEIFLAKAGYVFSSTVVSDIIYKEAINSLKEKNPLKRIIECNEYLEARGLKEKFLLGSRKK